MSLIHRAHTAGCRRWRTVVQVRSELPGTVTP